MRLSEPPPCLIVAHRRWEPLQRVISAVVSAEVQDVHVVIDGARSIDERLKIDTVEELVRDTKWPSGIHVHRRSTNRGVGYSVPEACDEFFVTRSSGIILEDDCVPTQEFFLLAEGGLKSYQQDHRVALVSGNCIATPPKSQMGCLVPEPTLRLSRYPLIWGWATWRDRWQNYRMILANWRRQVPLHTLAWRLGSVVAANDWRRLFDASSAVPPRAWSYQVAHMMLARNQFSVTPSIDLVENVGYGHDASNTQSTPSYSPKVPTQHAREEWWKMAQEKLTEGSLPKYMRSSDRRLARQVWSPPLSKRAVDRVCRR